MSIFGGVGGFVNSIVGGVSSALTPQNDFQASNPGYQGAYQNSQVRLNEDLNNQHALSQALLAQSQGQGVNLAQAQLNQATDQNEKQAAGMIASQKGINPGLAAKHIADQGAQINQQAAGQAAVMRGQQQLQAQSALGGLYGNMANQNIQNSSTAANGLNGINSVNAAVAGQNAAANQSTAGGLFNAGGAALGLAFANGGQVPNYHPLIQALAAGGVVAPSYERDKNLRAPSDVKDPSTEPADSPLRIKTFADGGAVSLDFASADPDNFFGIGSDDSKKPKKDYFNNPTATGPTASQQIARQMASQAGVTTMASGVDPLEFQRIGAFLKPNTDTPNADKLVGASYVPKGYGVGANTTFHPLPQYVPDANLTNPISGTQYKLVDNYAFSDGGKVPGKAIFGGDDPKNDTVPAMLSPGEIVVPRTATKSAESAKAFVDKEIAKRDGKKELSLENESDIEYTLKHPSGSTFRVAKKGISEKLASQIKSMGNKYADGTDGGVEVPGALSEEQLSGQAPIDTSSTAPEPEPGMASSFQGAALKGFNPQGMADVALKNSDPAVPATSTNAPHAEQSQVAQQAQSVPGMSASSNPFNAVLDKQMSLLDQQGKLQDIAHMHQAQAYDQYLTNLAEQQKMSDQVTKKFQTDQDQLHQAIVNTNIDPNRFWASKSAGSKTSTIIGLLLSGAGAGMSHQPNMAYQMLQKNIDDDINAQKTELGKKQNLYTMNLQKYRDDMAAQQATKAQLLTIASAQMQKQAALDGSPQALLNAQLQMNQIRLEKAKINQQFGQQQAMRAFYGAANNPNSEGGAPAQYEAALRSNPAFKDVPIARIGNRIYPAINGTSAEELRQLEPLAGNVVDNLKELQKIGSLGGKISPEQRAQAEVLRGQLLADIPKLKSVEIGGRRIPDSEIHLAEQYLGDPTSFMQSLTAGHRNQALMNSLIREVEAKRAANVIGYRGMNSLAAQPGFK